MPVLSVGRADIAAAGPAETNLVLQDAEGPGLSMAQILSIVRAYRWQTLTIAATITLLVAGFTKFMDKTYEASATLRAYYASHNPAQQEAPTDPVETFISTEIQLMQTGDVLLPVVDKLDLTHNKDYIAGYHGDGSTLREYAKDNLIKNLEVAQGKLGGQLVYVTASASDPVLAANIANTVADTYLEQERARTFGPASERAKAYAQELAELKHKVSLAQDQVTAFRQRTGLTDSSAGEANGQADVVEASLLSSLEQKYQEAQNARRAAEVAASTDSSSSAPVMGSVLIGNLKNQLADQERTLSQMKTTMGPAHPKVLEQEHEIAATKASLAAELATYQNNTSSQLAAARSLEAKLAAAVQEQRNKVVAVRKIQDEGTKYALELDSAQQVYKHALDGYDQIMYASGEHHLSLSNRAVPPLQAAKPNKPKVAMIGAIIGLLLGLAAPFVYELMINRRVRCRDDFERVFGLPVLSEFDAIEPSGSAA